MIKASKAAKASKAKLRTELDRDQGMVTPGMIRVFESPAFYPVVDVHEHIQPDPRCYEMAVRAMDAAGIAAAVNLAIPNGTYGRKLARHIKLASKYPGRFVHFCVIDEYNTDWSAKDLGKRFAKIIEESHDMGAAGFGELVMWDRHGRIAWDDERLEPMWEKLDELHMPVDWHVADPSRYWRPEGPLNMLEGPSYYGRGPLKYDFLMQQERVLERHPNLIVLAAHSNYLTDMVPMLIHRMETYPNYYLDLAASLEEWGRAPDDFQFICSEYKDRLFYGTDASFRVDNLPAPVDRETTVEHYKAFHLAHFLFLGTRQRTIPVPFNGNYGSRIVGWHRGFPRYANDGVNLPGNILKRIYYRNAERLPGMKAAGWKPATQGVATYEK